MSVSNSQFLLSFVFMPVSAMLIREAIKLCKMIVLFQKYEQDKKEFCSDNDLIYRR